ncbi:hypothetical protein BT96DRAFT_748908, partial [Gymnopus androsaceus JB14]
APVYAFFNPEPDIEFANDGTAEYIVFSCTMCRSLVKQGLKTSDKSSTGALIRHSKSCWGDEAVKAVQESKSLEKARDALKKFGKKSQSKLTAALRTVKGWAESFSTQPPSKKNQCYRWLQREGQPDRYVPSKETISRDVKHLYTRTKEKLALELQAHDSELAIAIDCWTSPNHRAWMSITISRTRKGKDGKEELVTHLLDFIEL